ncbi:MAG TPA: calcium-binding protein [Nocardioides sp.]|nr:calcium-binding protein [Nocardioides sp.]
MPSTSVRRLCAALSTMVLAAAPVALTAPAHAAEAATCTPVGDVLAIQVTTTHAGVDVFRSGGYVDVVAGADSSSCQIQNATGGSGILLTVGSNDPHTWTLHLTDPFTSPDATSINAINLGAQDSDAVTLDASGSPTPRAWTSSPGGARAFDTDTNPATYELAVSGTGPLSFVTGSGADTIDLSSLNTGQDVSIDTGSGNDVVHGGSTFDTIRTRDGNDTVFGGSGQDTIYDDTGNDDYYGAWQASSDGWPDTIILDEHGGTDTVDTGAGGDFSDTLVYDDHMMPSGVSVSIDGLANDGTAGENDNIGTVGTVVTGGGNDTVSGTNLFSISTGNGDDTLIAPTSGVGPLWMAGGGTDTLDLSGEPDGAQGDLSASITQIYLPFTSVSASALETVIGTPHPDAFTVHCSCSVQPGLGADSLSLEADGAAYVADPGADGADTVTADDGFSTTADYELRTTAVSLTSDDEANDGGAGEGDDIGTRITTLIGGAGNDTLVGSGVANKLFGLGGADSLSGRGGADRLYGGVGNDALAGGSGDDTLLGQGAADRLAGGDGDDLLRGDDPTDVQTAGKDTLDGGNGDDDEFGYAGDDTFTAGATANGSDLLVGGTGTDTASYALRSAAVRLSLNGRYDDGAAGEGDRIGTDVENLTGGKGADLLIGGPTHNLLLGGSGNDDFQTVGGGVDALNGGAGTDKAHRDNTDTVVSVEKRY